MLDKLIWKDDRVLLNDLVFRVEPKRDDWELGEQCFAFYKFPEILRQYRHFFSLQPAFQPQQMFEVGIWDGGSLALWFEVFQPRKYVAIDLEQRDDSEYFRQYVSSRNIQSRLKTFWNTNQADSDKILQIVKTEFDGPLDLVIDDGSHEYSATLRTLEALLPLVRSDGFYIIEDWAWAHQPDTVARFPRYSEQRALSDLAVDLLGAAGTPGRLIKSLVVYSHFLVIVRGDISAGELGHFKLEDHIFRREQDLAQSKAR
jgi:hypothetical protein